MDIIKILDNIMIHVDKYNIDCFKLGIVGNGEPLLEYEELKGYILHISDYIADGRIEVYSITNGLLVDEEKLGFFKRYKVNLGFSIDGLPEIHDMYRCGTHAKTMEKIELYKKVNGVYPSMNCTVGKEVLVKKNETIEFFRQFNTRITFSRMIGPRGISLEEFRGFLETASEILNVRTGGYDCTMYGGMCGAGINNIFYANGKIYICGNCIDLSYSLPFDTSLSEVVFDVGCFDRHCCYKEISTK
jgi:uncharacterized protein